MRLAYASTQHGRGLTDIGPLQLSRLKTQRGRGIGNFFGGLWTHIKPLAISGLKTLTKQSLKSGGNILKELAKGDRNIKTIVKNEGVQALENLTTKGINKLKEKAQAGEGLILRSGPIKRRKLLSELPVVQSKRRRRMAARSTVKKRRARRGPLIGRGCCGKRSKGKKTQKGGRRKTKAGSKRRRRRRQTKNKTRSLDIFDY